MSVAAVLGRIWKSVSTICLIAILSACGGGGGSDGSVGGSAGGGGGSEDALQLSINNTSNGSYQWSTASAGSQVYIDRSFVYVSFPETFVSSNASLLQTANDDKASSGDTFISFLVNQQVTVYVAYDSNISTLPNWLSDWTNTGETIVADFTNFTVYSKTFNEGTITLGGNEDGANSMYTVLVIGENGSGSTGGSTDGGSTGGGSGDGGTGGSGGGGSGGSTTGAVPMAVNDNASTSQNTSVLVDVTSNDTDLTDGPITTSIFSNPDHGTVSVESTGIQYTPNSGYAGADSFVYRVTDNDGDFATATVNINVTCANCAANTTVTLSWTANNDLVSGYEIYYAISNVATDATTLFSNVSLSQAGFNPSAPSVDFDAWNELGLNRGESICFRLKAYNSAGTSGYSSGVCQQVPL